MTTSSFSTLSKRKESNLTVTSSWLNVDVCEVCLANFGFLTILELLNRSLTAGLETDVYSSTRCPTYKLIDTKCQIRFGNVKIFECFAYADGEDVRSIFFRNPIQLH
jgi:hypothetical protein